MSSATIVSSPRPGGKLVNIGAGLLCSNRVGEENHGVAVLAVDDDVGGVLGHGHSPQNDDGRFARCLGIM